MNITNILKNHGTTVTQFAAILGLSRNRTYNFMNLYEKGLKVSNKYAYQWAFEYLFNNELLDEEFILRMNEIRIKLTENKIQNSERKIYGKKVLELGQNNYIIYDNIKHFEFIKAFGTFNGSVRGDLGDLGDLGNLENN